MEKAFDCMYSSIIVLDWKYRFDFRLLSDQIVHLSCWCDLMSVFIADRRRKQQQQILHYSVAGIRHKERVQRLESLGSCWVQRSKFITAMPL